MSWSNLKAGISVVVKENNNQEITGTNLQNVLITIVNSLGANATCGGIAHPNTSPGTPDGPVFWIASGPGVYVNFGNTKIDNTGIFIWNGTSWSFEELDFMKNMQTDIANSVLQSVSFGVTGNTATLTIKQKGYDAITVSVPIATDSQSGFMTAEQVKYIDDLREYTDGLREDIDDLREDIPNLQNKLDAAYGEINIDNIDSLCTADDMLQGKPACYTVLYTLTTSKGTVTVKVGVLWVYSDNLRHVVMQVLNTNFVPDDDGTFSSHTHNHDMHEYSRIYCYDSNAASHAGVAVKTWTQWQEVGGKGIVDLITNVALAKQNKLTAGDKATRIDDDANIATKQIYKGTVINTNTAPVALPVGAYCFNTATKKLYVGAQHGYALVTDTVPMPDDFLFIDTASGTTYRCDGTTLNNIANTEALQNKLGKDSVVQTTGTATDKVMSQKAVTDDINSAISFARRQGVPQAKCFLFSENYTFYSGSQLKDKTLIVGLYGAGDFLKGGSIYYNNSVHELQIGNGERKRLTGRTNNSEHAETLVVYFDDDGIAHAYMDGKLCYDFPSNTQPDTVTINVLESRKFKQILLLDGDLHQAANDLLWAKGWQDWLINNRNMNTTREVIKIDNSTDLWMAAGWTAAGTTSYKLYVVDYNITNNTEKEAKVSVNANTIGYGGDIVIPAGQSVSVRRLIDTSTQGALGYNGSRLPFSLTAKSVAVIKGIDYRYVYNGGYYDLAGLAPIDEPTIIPNPEEYLKVKSTNIYPDAVGQIGYDATGRLYMSAIDLTWKQINNT